MLFDNIPFTFLLSRIATLVIYDFFFWEALTLILNRGNGALLSPVDCRWNFYIGRLDESYRFLDSYALERFPEKWTNIESFFLLLPAFTCVLYIMQNGQHHVTGKQVANQIMLSWAIHCGQLLQPITWKSNPCTCDSETEANSIMSNYTRCCQSHWEYLLLIFSCSWSLNLMLLVGLRRTKKTTKHHTVVVVRFVTVAQCYILTWNRFGWTRSPSGRIPRAAGRRTYWRAGGTSPVRDRSAGCAWRFCACFGRRSSVGCAPRFRCRNSCDVATVKGRRKRDV